MLSPFSSLCGCRSLLWLGLLLLANLSCADFVGTITMSDSQIEATGVTYSFNLRFTRQISDPNGKLVIRFPHDFQTQFSVTDCTTTSGFNLAAGMALPCSYVPSVRLLTISSAFPTTFTEIQFDVKGVTNPKYAATTQSFTVDSYVTSGGEFVTLESSTPTIVITPTAGAISGESLALASPVVGAYSDLTVALQTKHAIPATGKIEINFPKWNPFAPNQSQMESFVSTATSPGVVPCTPGSGLPVLAGSDLSCIFTQGSTTDTLTVSFAGSLTGDIAANTPITVKV